MDQQGEAVVGKTTQESQEIDASLQFSAKSELLMSEANEKCPINRSMLKEGEKPSIRVDSHCRTTLQRRGQKNQIK